MMMTELELVRAALEGSQTAWEEIVSRYGNAIFSLCLQFTMLREDAEELTQEVFIKLYNTLHLWKPEKPLLAWIMAITRNRCIDAYRKARQQKRLDRLPEEMLDVVPAGGRNAEQEVLLKEKTSKLMEYLHELPEDTASMILMRDLLGLSYEELAEIYSLPVGTVKSRLNRGRLTVAFKLRDHFARGKEEAV
jgi:RNA polymerase sigma-70 factor (ECF subfamily)